MKQEISELLEQLRVSDWWDRRKIVQKLLRHPESEYADFLEAAIRNHEDASVRNAAMEVYTSLGERALPLLVDLAQDEDPEVRLFSVNILGEIGSLRGLHILFRSIKDPDENVRIASAESLGKIGDAGALDVLRKALQQDAWMAMAALHAIGNIGGSPSLEILYSCLPTEEFRDFAITAIELAGDESSIPPLAEAVSAAQDPFQKELALKAMVNIAHRNGFQIPAEILSPFVPFLTELCHSPDQHLRAAAVTALAWSGDSRALPFFIEAVQDDQLRDLALEGILGIGPGAGPEIRRALEAPATGQREILEELLEKLGCEDATVG